ncbi:MAG: DUF3606 domain-containing protein [Burkholderiales bacterium]
MSRFRVGHRRPGRPEKDLQKNTSHPKDWRAGLTGKEPLHQSRRCSLATYERKTMSDDLKSRGPQDRARMNMNEASEVTYWCKEFGCTADQLRTAVKAVGVMVKDIRVHLGRYGPTPPGDSPRWVNTEPKLNQA